MHFEAIAKLYGSDLVRGFYHPDVSGSVAFVPLRAGSGDTWDLDTESIFFHEYSHHLQLQSATIAMPAWVTEGFAEFFATADVNEDGSVSIGSWPKYRNFGLHNDVAGLSLAEMVGGAFNGLDGEQIDRLYARGWLLTHYLTFNRERKGQLGKYVMAIQKGIAPRDAAVAAFGDLRALDKELERYMDEKLPGLKIPASEIKVGPVAVRELTPGEAAIMDVRIHSRRGVDSEAAPGVAADARRVEARFAGDPAVETATAEAEFDARNFAAAEAAASRAIASDPSNIRALLYKGQAQMELAREHPEKADWAAIRGWFTRANKLDTENAEPLYLYYKSYAYARQPAPKGVVDGLLYAVALVPQDEGVRTDAVRQLLVEGHLGEAKEMFSPLAFLPHASKDRREANRKIMAAISAGDGKTALALLNAPPKPKT